MARRVVSRPAPGQKVSFTTRYRNPGYGVPGGMRERERWIETTYRNVEVLPSPDWLTPREFAIPSDDPRQFISVIHLSSVVGEKPWKKAPRSADRVIRIEASDGRKFYLIRIRGGVPVSCTCPGFQYRNRCRHLNEVEEKLR